MLRIYKKPPAIQYEANDFVNNILPLGLLLHICFAIYIFSCKELFPIDMSYMSSSYLEFAKEFANTYIGINKISFYDRFYRSLFLTILLIIFAVVFIFDWFIIGFFRVLCSKKQSYQATLPENQPEQLEIPVDDQMKDKKLEEKSYSEIKSELEHKHGIASYDMQANPLYKEIMDLLTKYSNIRSLTIRNEGKQDQETLLKD